VQRRWSAHTNCVTRPRLRKSSATASCRASRVRRLCAGGETADQLLGGSEEGARNAHHLENPQPCVPPEPAAEELKFRQAEDTGPHLLPKNRVDLDDAETRDEVPRAGGRQELVYLGAAHFLVVVLAQGAENRCGEQP
jgi:hypothetical protein